MQVFIVHAHPEPLSFNGALTATARDHLAAAGHQVVVSDLYAMGWQARSDRTNFTSVADPDLFRQQQEELLASEVSGFAADIAREQEKLFASDVLILQFPLWWFGLPGLLKGWVDRVFAMGRIYGAGRWYDRGVFAPRRAMLSLTTGGPASMYGPDGLHGDMDTLLYPIHHGILRFTGFEVLPPFIAWGPARVSEEVREAYLMEYRRRLDRLATAEPLGFPHVDRYDPESFRLRRAAALPAA